ncbi:MAG: cytochrome B6 [Synechococcaceae cyanobacterium]|nr:cytochrome B6 [Synechococcaceae cyanobacterium]
MPVPAFLPPLPLAFSTAGDAADGLLPFGLDITTLQRGTLVYLGLSSLAFVLVWLIGYLRRR